ncbi:MAG: hypothetical protein A2V85_07250 [Chloroflexi bacterium RBG_16_72_14]|nr:MAG: hypothetical protein A2V85_07250 [Chloroflexi bacterium RBG_16_72_14]
MNDGTSLEHRLASAYAVVPADGFAFTDRRVAALTAVTDAPRRLPWRRLRVGLALAAALVLLAGAAAAAINLLDRVMSATPGTAVAWDQGVEIGQRQVHGDYAVTLARGYVDVNRVVLAVSVERVDGTGPVDAGFVTELRDPAGVLLASGTGLSFGGTDDRGLAEVLAFAPPTSNDGEYALRLGLMTMGASEPDMPWTFRFALPAPVGAVVRVDQTRETQAASVDLGEVRLGATMITASIHIEPSDREASGWAAMGYLEHGDATIDIDWGSIPGPSDLDLIAGTNAGTEDPAGAWMFVITELVGERPDDTQVRLQGPWEFPFSVP